MSYSISELFDSLRLALDQNNTKAIASSLAKLSTHSMQKRRWRRARSLVKRAEHYLPESAKLTLLRSICEWELKDEREAKKKVSKFVKVVLKRRNLPEYSALVEKELSRYPALRLHFYETVIAVERNVASAFIGMSRIFSAQKDYIKAVDSLKDALRTRDSLKEVLGEMERLFLEMGRQDLGQQLDRFRRKELSMDDFLVLLSSHRPLTQLDAENGTQEINDLQQMIETLEQELGATPQEKEWDTVNPLVAEFRHRAAAVIGTDSKTRMDLALAFFEMKLFAPAVSELKLISSEDPHYPQAQCLLGQVWFAEKSYLLALEAFQTALRDAGENERLKSDAEYQLIKVYLKLEDFGKAMVHLRELEEREGDYRDLKRIKEIVATKLGVEALPKARTEKKLRKTG